jgi:hypothetical protein
MAVERELGEHPFIAERAEDDALRARHVERLQALFRDQIEQLLRRFGSGFALQDDDHLEFPFSGVGEKEKAAG